MRNSDGEPTAPPSPQTNPPLVANRVNLLYFMSCLLVGELTGTSQEGALGLQACWQITLGYWYKFLSFKFRRLVGELSLPSSLFLAPFRRGVWMHHESVDSLLLWVCVNEGMCLCRLWWDRGVWTIGQKFHSLFLCLAVSVINQGGKESYIFEKRKKCNWSVNKLSSTINHLPLCLHFNFAGSIIKQGTLPVHLVRSAFLSVFPEFLQGC